MGKAPAFQFYAADFISDIHVATMSLAERGAYITLLCYCWIDGGIPDDQEKLSRLLGVNLETMGSLWRPLWGRFEKRGDLLVSPRLEKVRKQQEEYRNSQRESGIRGANARWKKKLRKNGVRHSDPNGDPNGETMAKEVEEAVEVEVGVGGKEKGVKGGKDGGGKKVNLNADFDRLWEVYPLKVNPTAAAIAWHKRRKSGTLPPVDDLIDAVRRHMKSDQWTRDGGRAIPHACTWINEGRWLDDYEVKGISKAPARPGNPWQPERDPADEGKAARLEEEDRREMERLIREKREREERWAEEDRDGLSA